MNFNIVEITSIGELERSEWGDLITVTAKSAMIEIRFKLTPLSVQHVNVGERINLAMEFVQSIDVEI